MNFLTSLLPLQGRIMLLIALAVALWGHGYVKGVSHEEGAQAKRDIAATKVNATITANWQKGVDNAIAQRTEEAQVNDLVADRLADTVVGLRDQLRVQTGKLPQGSLNACTAYSTALSAVFAECADTARGLAKAAAGHAADSLMYQEAWPK